MCLIEEKNSIKPLIACATSCEEGQNIFTNTEAVAFAREGVLEFLLINHPLDCPICDQGGECDLQDQTIVFGADFGRFYEDKKTVPNKNFGAVVKTFFNRCIYCTRCVRFFEEFGEDNELLMLGRSENSEIGFYLDQYLKSELAGNVTDLCPVGALLIKPTSFRGRF
jgi:NADH dehydrogenase/NADH:ubiquinone oxidoreductase subunit G